MQICQLWTEISIKKSDAFFGSKITFGENVKTLVKYGEFSKSARSSQKSRNRHKTPTQYRSNAHFGTFQKLQNLPCIYPSEDRLQAGSFFIGSGATSAGHQEGSAAGIFPKLKFFTWSDFSAWHLHELKACLGTLYMQADFLTAFWYIDPCNPRLSSVQQVMNEIDEWPIGYNRLEEWLVSLRRAAVGSLLDSRSGNLNADMSHGRVTSHDGLPDSSSHAHAIPTTSAELIAIVPSPIDGSLHGSQ